jgi:hypothetical protein
VGSISRSNLCWLVFAVTLGYRKLAFQSIVFSGSSTLGILNSFLPGNAVQRWLQAVLS